MRVCLVKGKLETIQCIVSWLKNGKEGCFFIINEVSIIECERN